MRLKVENMTCGHCANAVTKAAQSVDGVNDPTVDLKSGELSLSGTPDAAALIAAIDKAGYPATVIEK
ncbi:cation transporter [Thalassospira sp. MA62]|nr:cation transporter [Thalassospira sp. MA62]